MENGKGTHLTSTRSEKIFILENSVDFVARFT